MKATWILPDNRRITADVKEGLSLMEAAVANNIPNVIGECGGNLSCATCHVYVDDAWVAASAWRATLKTRCLMWPRPSAARPLACPVS